MQKREVEELKKLEKIIKKERNDFEDVAGTGATNAKLVYNKIVRTLNNMRNVSKQHHELKTESDKFQFAAAQSKQETEKCLKQKSMLSNICDSLMDQNFAMYLKHEQMLDEEARKRKELAEQFQKKMADLSSEI
jgi:hypothetical protein